MVLNRVEQIAALSLLAKPDLAELGWLIETTKNLPAKQKIAALAGVVRVAVNRDDAEARQKVLEVITDPGPKVISFVRPDEQATG